MKRNDAKQVYDIPAYNKLFPFMMRRRCDSLVYHTFDLDVTKAVEYIHNYNKTKPEVRLKLFYIICSALLRTFALRPELNRFIAKNRYWQRNELSLNFVVKSDYTDDALETSSPLVFNPEGTLDEYSKILEK
ncbi:MAG: 2-oxoacid:acceptor oxidoreductase, partial [Sphaerochaetaceae bacterium]|nr:2-oxoacid:acceptor oxidoreductase [Sphaerochaetaceae bacterium]